MEISQHSPEQRAHRTPPKWSRLGQLAKGAATAQCNREREGCPRGRRWTREEEQIVRDLYPNFALIRQRLPHRTMNQLKCFAYDHGISTRKLRLWTMPELAVLRKAAREGWSTAQIIAVLPHRNRTQIKDQRKRRGIKLHPRYRILGVPVIDEIREQGWKRNLSLAEMDAICGGGQYWSQCKRTPNWSKIAKVVEFMGGTLRIDLSEVVDA